MRALVPHRQAQVVTANELPNTMIPVDVVRPPVVTADVKLFILDNLVTPLLDHFPGGKRVDEQTDERRQERLPDMLIGFEPEVYGIAARTMILEREDPFFPTVAEIRKSLEQAEMKHYGSGGQVRKPSSLANLLSHILKSNFRGSGYVWDRDMYGPAPGEPGCRLDDGAIAKQLRSYLEDGFEVSGDPPRGHPSIAHHRRKRVAERVGLDMTTHETFRAVLVEMGIAHTPDEIAAVEARIATWCAEHRLGALRREAAEARRDLFNSQGWLRQAKDEVRGAQSPIVDRHQREVDAAQAKLDEMERAIAIAEQSQPVAT